jgi:hypothetical protein
MEADVSNLQKPRAASTLPFSPVPRSGLRPSCLGQRKDGASLRTDDRGKNLYFFSA